MKFRVKPFDFDALWQAHQPVGQPFWVSHHLTLDSITPLQAYAALSQDVAFGFIQPLSPMLTVLGFAPDQVLIKEAPQKINSAHYLTNGQLRLREAIDDYQQVDFQFPPTPLATHNLTVGNWFGYDISDFKPCALQSLLPQAAYMRPKLLLVFNNTTHVISLHALVDSKFVPDQANAMIQAETLIENALHRLSHFADAFLLHNIVPPPEDKHLWADAQISPDKAYVSMAIASPALCFYRHMSRLDFAQGLQLLYIDHSYLLATPEQLLAVFNDDKIYVANNTDQTEPLLAALYAAEYA